MDGTQPNLKRLQFLFWSLPSNTDFTYGLAIYPLLFQKLGTFFKHSPAVSPTQKCPATPWKKMAPSSVTHSVFQSLLYILSCGITFLSATLNSNTIMKYYRETCREREMLHQTARWKEPFNNTPEPLP